MSSKYGDLYSETSYQIYHSSYARNAKAIGVLWAIFTVCFAIINIVAFVQPQWIGDTLMSPGTGHFGLYRYCRWNGLGTELSCDGTLNDFSTIPSHAWRASTVFIGISALIILLCICAMILFFFLHPATVYQICGWMQAVSALLMFLGVVIYPSGWDHPVVRSVCGADAVKYYPGGCGIRWAYILAILGLFDAIVLSALAFVLGSRYIRLSETIVNNRDAQSMYKGDINSAYTGTGIPVDAQSVVSRRSMNLQPVLYPSGGQDDGKHMSEFTARRSMGKPQTPRVDRQDHFQL
ncbi:Lipoma HMGIC fusion partner-like 3 protein [Hypsibius exemplaris]|uniref:Lipoma HMGIC fusion partner-like 3 protein n=1 Tax=Hypsibius exemplaris TaxID=2072580 RepID=A0A1W0X2J1_HYPEX|nr:Lipoma HMGIC fusion partner-like 3 protein [Hypsibius exemplaris]